MSTPWSQRAANLWHHWRRGTLQRRLRSQLRRRRRRQLLAASQRRADSFRQLRHQGVPSVPYRLPEGPELTLPTDSHLAAEIYGGAFELGEQDFLSRYLMPGDVFLDVGANLGLFTLRAAGRVTDSGRVFAFEPSAKTFQRLHQDVERNGLHWVQAIQAALSDAPGQATLHASSSGWDAWNSLGAPAEGDGYAQEEVELITLDAFLEEHPAAARAALIKLDVEGWESRVLTGGGSLFASAEAPTLLVEFNDEAAAGAGTSGQALYRQLAELGYDLLLWDSDLRQLLPAAPKEHYVYENLVATKNLLRDQERLS
ncbi:MAG: FkbM family methyltransferase [Acidobacteriota bacterium]